MGWPPIFHLSHLKKYLALKIVWDKSNSRHVTNMWWQCTVAYTILSFTRVFKSTYVSNCNSTSFHIPLKSSKNRLNHQLILLKKSANSDFDYIQHVEYTVWMCNEIWPKTRKLCINPLCTSQWGICFLKYFRGIMSYHTPFFSEIFNRIDQLLHCAQMNLWLGMTSRSHNMTNQAKSMTLAMPNEMWHCDQKFETLGFWPMCVQ